MSDIDKGMIRGFYQLSRSWYGVTAITAREGVVDELMIGYYGPDGDGGTTAEFCVRWYELGGKPEPRLEMFADSWRLLTKWEGPSEFFSVLSYLSGQAVTPERLCELLLMMGFKDMTKETRE